MSEQTQGGTAPAQNDAPNTQPAQPAPAAPKEPQPYHSDGGGLPESLPQGLRERFAELNDKRKAAEKTLADERAAWTAEKADWQTKVQTAVGEAQTNAMRADLYRLGIHDDEALDIARIRYDRIKPKEGETKQPFGAYMEGEKAAGAKWLQGYLSGPAAGSSVPAPMAPVVQPAAPVAQPVQPDGAGAKRPDVSGSLSLDRLMADTSPHAWKQMRESVLPGAKKGT